MNPRHAMQGRRFLFKEIGGRRKSLYFVWFPLCAYATLVVGAFSLAGGYEERNSYTKTYITQEEFWKHQYEALEKRQDHPFQIFCTDEQRERMTALLIEIQETGGRF